jgi:hypothetical protein
MERREPVIEDQGEEEPAPEPQTASAGGVRPPGRVGSGLWDDEGSDEPPRGGGGSHWSNPNIFHMAIEDLNLSMRANNCLRRSGLMTVGQVIERSEEELLSLRNFGQKEYDELRERLDELGILGSREALPVGTGHPPSPLSPGDLFRHFDQDPPVDSG